MRARVPSSRFWQHQDSGEALTILYGRLGIALWVRAKMPGPGGAHDLVEIGEGWLEAEYRACTRRVGNKDGRIALATRAESYRESCASFEFNRVQDLHD